MVKAHGIMRPGRFRLTPKNLIGKPFLKINNKLDAI